jgi:myo-inositol 2-dehydrogenase/D-chiro-inositol 1-dehydrogenase
MNDTHHSLTNRRDFLKTSAVAGTVLAANLSQLSNVHAAGDDIIKVGLIGCGGRGSGAAENVLNAAKGVEIVAVGDYYKDKVDGLRRRLLNAAREDGKIKELGNKVDLPADRCYTGLDAYQKVINTPGVNYIILATPPGFRPLHLQAAVAAGKNVFTEKPVAVDGPGIRKVLDVYEEANSKKLGIGAGTQRRHQLGYLETMKQIHDGAIGDIVAAQCYWNQGSIWFHPRKDGMTDLDYQIHNWYHFVWTCGDHIVEQHVHNIDVVNWATGQHPIRAVGMGGRVRPCSDPNVDGHIYNFFAIDYEYPKGVHVLSQCRQIPNCANSVSEALVGTKGMCQANTYTINGKPVMDRQQGRRGTDPYVQEHTDLIASIRAGKPYNELKSVAESTLTAILGRMSAYTGKSLTWEQALHSQEELMPLDRLRAGSLPVPPVAEPGKTKFV